MDEQLTVGSLFAGIGGFDLGLERAGMRSVWFCERDAYCQRVLATHWPNVSCYPDVRSLVADTARDGETGSAPQTGAERQRAGSGGQLGSGRSVQVPVPWVDVLCGGFPCQDLSAAGRGAGLSGARSGLWSEYARLIGELRPRYVVVENVPPLRRRGLDQVLEDLDACGYDAEWDGISASACGAPHRRDRIWIVAYPRSDELWQQSRRRSRARRADPPLAGVDGASRGVADPEAIAFGTRLREGEPRGLRGRRSGAGVGTRAARSAEPDLGCVADGLPARLDDHWRVERGLPRTADGVAHRTEQLSALGNALVPQIAEWLGRRIIEWESR